jgi:AhpD family alkylhydroperoxidase
VYKADGVPNEGELMSEPKARMSYVTPFPDLIGAIQAVTKTVETSGVPPKTLNLVHLRASQINGCSVCCDMHARAMKGLGESDSRLFGVAAWRDSPYFTPPERAALALTEAVTRIADREDPVPDAVWEEATRHYDERAMTGLLVNIAAINVWNRLNVATHQVPREWTGSWDAAGPAGGAARRPQPATG